MKLWIRSQERDKLEICNSLSTQPIIAPNKKHQTWGIISNFGCIGEYGTRERCLEIIDEIQELLIGDFTIIKNLNVCDDFQKMVKNTIGTFCIVPIEKPTVEYYPSSAVVYEMPEE
jgi:hypothetical protein